MITDIRAIFASEDTYDQFSRRSLVVASDRHILIGRAPNHATKKPKAAFDNFYLMSPIVSRRHATITISEAGVSCFLIDRLLFRTNVISII